MRLAIKPEPPTEIIDDLFVAVDPQEMFRLYDGPRLFGIKQTQLAKKILQGEIPQPIKFFGSGRATGWSGHQINQHRRKIAAFNASKQKEAK